jgi:hypothetical protein
MVASGQIPLMAAQVAATPTTITPTGRRRLFALQGRFDLTRSGSALGYGAVYDVMPKSGELVAVVNGPLKPSGDGDGSVADAANRPKLHVVLNWGEELKRLVPVE